jgi:hypothetical protein
MAEIVFPLEKPNTIADCDEEEHNAYSPQVNGEKC